MDKENVGYTNSVTVFGHKKEGNPATRKDGLEGIMLSESSQTEKNKYYRISPIRGIWKTNKLNSQIQSTGCWLTETRVASRWKGWRWSGGTSFQLLDKQVTGDEQHNGSNCCRGCSVANTSHSGPRSPPGSSIHGISQARILGWAAISFCRGSSWPRHLLHWQADSLPLSHQWNPMTSYQYSVVYLKAAKTAKLKNSHPMKINVSMYTLNKLILVIIL